MPTLRGCGMQYHPTEVSVQFASLQPVQPVNFGEPRLFVCSQRPLQYPYSLMYSGLRNDRVAHIVKANRKPVVVEDVEPEPDSKRKAEYNPDGPVAFCRQVCYQKRHAR